MEAAKARLVDELEIESNEIHVSAVEPVEWSDTSLGCPKPGQTYAQVITPGYQITLEAKGDTYELHTDRSGRTIVLAVNCEDQLERGPSAGVAHLAHELGISVEEIDVVSVEMVEWPDTSLGCPELGMSYAQVVTPGYRIILRAQGGRHEVHTDQRGQIIVICRSES